MSLCNANKLAYRCRTDDKHNSSLDDPTGQASVEAEAQQVWSRWNLGPSKLKAAQRLAHSFAVPDWIVPLFKGFSAARRAVGVAERPSGSRTSHMESG